MIIAVTIPSFLKGNAEGVNLQGEVQGSRGSGGRGNYGQVVFFFLREKNLASLEKNSRTFPVYKT